MKEFYEGVHALLETNGIGEGRYSVCSHDSGLPNESFVEVRPEYSPVDGDCVILVTPTAVKMYGCAVPFNVHRWKLLRGVREYKTHDALIVMLKDWLKEPRGCW